MKRSRGFTLVEMAVVVVIIAALLTLGLGALNAQLSSASYTTTKQRQAAIKDALIGYLGANKSFPCPQTATAGATPTGVAPAPSAPLPACPSFGIVPFKTLGIAREVAQDGWGNFFSYQVYAQPNPPPVCPSAAIDWGAFACFGAGKINSGFTVNDGTVSAPTLMASNVAAVVISHGPNGLGAWAAQGTRNAPPTNCEEFNNAVGIPPPLPPSCTLTPNVFYKGESQDRDDVVAYLTASDAIQQLGKQGTINSAIAQVNIDLQTLYDQAIANNTLTAPPLPGPYCRSAPTPIPDPWGYPYGSVATGNNDPEICLYSTGGSLPAPPAVNGNVATNTCSCNSPANCRAISNATLTNYRNRANNTTPCT